MASLPAVEDITVNHELNALLECPVCMKTMTESISQCTNGHNICKYCKEKLNTCPVCQGTFTGVRNRLAEELAGKLYFHCPNADAGCPDKILGSQLETHGRYCLHRIHKCFLSNCSWTGRKPEIINHFNDKHKKYVFTDSLVFYIRNFDVDGVVNGLILAYGEIFWCSQKTDSKRQTVQWTVQFIGPESRASEFRYELKLESADKSGKNIYTYVPDNEQHDIQNIFQSSKGLELGVRTLHSFLDSNNKISMHLRVFKNDGL